MAFASLFDVSAEARAPGVRTAGPAVLSLALIDARNATLRLLQALEPGLQARGEPAAAALAIQLAGHAGWFAEYWIGRNTRRAAGVACPASPTRLASIEPGADAWWARPEEAADSAEAPAWVDRPDTDATRAYLEETLEGTLELLDKAPDTDEALYFYRLALLHEDLRHEQLLRLAQAHGVALVLPQATSAGASRAALSLPATRWTLGAPAPGFSFDNENGEHVVEVPAFEIDAVPVSWAQYAEFVDDGGYEREALWLPDGWRWLAAREAQHQRGPRHVEQIGAAGQTVVQQRFGRSVRVEGRAPALHLAWWEADAWARWAGRRLPSEVEWEVAARHGGASGFAWGDVREWCSNSLRPWPGFVAGPWADYSTPWFGRARVLRGASFLTPERLRHPRFRGFALPGDDGQFAGLRTCAI
ncbi:MAG: ergothioneine biosynthesis protein EgtB [Lysobacteraceae bacterium]|nr:MAG: ergothioneine biosynthesis protein EgtB [Xanthomonadaceae bacterium]